MYSNPPYSFQVMFYKVCRLIVNISEYACGFLMELGPNSTEFRLLKLRYFGSLFAL